MPDYTRNVSSDRSRKLCGFCHAVLFLGLVISYGLESRARKSNRKGGKLREIWVLLWYKRLKKLIRIFKIFSLERNILCSLNESRCQREE